ncbi:hypothetical protein G6514_005574 [Epicoccum nigrum]|nr:hypothetical protein G6514_005574 [Epicoccum nigrum]
MNIAPQRPSTAQSLSLGSRMPFEAAEALLWERQNNRVHAHLSVQMKKLQAEHDKFDARIQATEAVAEAAEAAIHKIKQMDTKIAAIEAEERDRPFDTWAKESISALQMSVDAMRGVRQKLSGLETKVDQIGEGIETVQGESASLNDVVRRLEVLECARQDDARKVTYLEEELGKLESGHGQPRGVFEYTLEQPRDGAQADDHPMAVFYGVDTQSPLSRHKSSLGRQESPVRRERSPIRKSRSPMRLETRLRNSYDTPDQEFPMSKPTKSSRWSHGCLKDLQPSDGEPLLRDEGGFEPLESQPQVNGGWENTQQYRDMQRELVALQAMCPSQEVRSSNDTGATQRLQETVLVSTKNNVDFSDATTEPEADDNNLRTGARQDPGYLTM